MTPAPAVPLSLPLPPGCSSWSPAVTNRYCEQSINEKPQVVGEYESGKAIPNPQLIGKLERALGVRLPRPGKKAGKK